MSITFFLDNHQVVYVTLISNNNYYQVFKGIDILNIKIYRSQFLFRGLSFRKAFKKLSELICIFPTPDSVHLAMTATATPTAIKELVDDLQFTDVTIITVNPDRPNIKLEVHNVRFITDYPLQEKHRKI